MLLSDISMVFGVRLNVFFISKLASLAMNQIPRKYHDYAIFTVLKTNHIEHLLNVFPIFFNFYKNGLFKEALKFSSKFHIVFIY